MKYAFCFLVLCTYNYCQAQFDWQVLEPIAMESLTIKHVSEDDVIMGALLYPPTLLVSSDLGNTWEELYKVEENIISLSSSSLDIRQDDNLDYFFNSGDKIYRLDEIQKELNLFIEAEETIWDYDFLPDGNVVVATDKEMYLFDAQGTQLRKVELSTVHRELHIGEGDQHYVGRFEGGTNVVLPFSTDFSDLASNDHILVNFNSGYLFSDGRLYTNFGYLDDSNLWTNYSGGLNGTITIMKDGRLHLIDGAQAYLSADRGENFTLLGRSDDLSIVYRESASIGEDGVLLYNTTPSSCNLVAHQFSLDGISDWKELDTEQGQSIAATIEAYNEDNIFAGTCFNGVSHFKISKDESWRNFDPENVSCEEIRDLISTPSGNLITSMRCYSENGGLDWVRSTGKEFFSLFYKADNIYVVDWDQVFLSEDEGRTWSSYSLDFSSVPFGEWMPMDVSEAGLLYFSNFENTIAAFNRAGELEYELSFTDLAVSDLKTSFTGTEIYFLQSSFIAGGQLNLIYSYDAGITFDTLNVTSMLDSSYGSIETDHLGNVFLYAGSKLWMSQDKAQTWIDISPETQNLERISDLDISWDNHIYLATLGEGVMRSATALTVPASLTIVVYEDVNSDCAFDSSDKLLEDMSVSIGDIRLFTKANGEVNSFFQNGTYEVTLAGRSDLYASCIGTQTITLDAAQGNTTVYIPVEILENCVDLGVSSTTPFLRRCFDNVLHLEVFNEGTAQADFPLITLELDSFFIFKSSSFTVQNQSGNTLTLRAPNIGAREVVRGKLNFELSCEADLGQSHYVTGSIEADNLCGELQQSSFTFECRENIGSYDPNDKSIYVDGIADKDIIDEDSNIEYLIRFQNTGTDTAFNVRIEDTLTEYFDASSINPVAASHDYSWELEDRKLIVHFENIMLVDSLTNEEDSHGFIRFSVGLNDNRPLPGASVVNTAAIYFDFNDPIVTNTVEAHYLCIDRDTVITASTCPDEPYFWETTGQNLFVAGSYTTTIQTTLGCNFTEILNLTILPEDDAECQSSSTSDAEVSGITIFPNPAQHSLAINHKENKTLSACTMYNLQGELVLRQSLEKENTVNIQDLDAGLYLLDLSLKDGSRLMKRVVIVK